jgi:hypothetical protein
VRGDPVTEHPIAGGDDREWIKVPGEELRLVDFVKFGAMDSVITRDLVRDVRSLPLLYMGVIARRQDQTRPEAEEVGHIVSWTDLAVIAAQIDWIVVNMLDIGQRVSFGRIRRATLTAADEVSGQ